MVSGCILALVQMSVKVDCCQGEEKKQNSAAIRYLFIPFFCLKGLTSTINLIFTFLFQSQRIYLLWGVDDIIFDKEEVRNLKEYAFFSVTSSIY
jgi:hypothetical protein